MANMKRVALVTGAARGIGFGIAERLALDGAHVIITDVTDDVQKSADRLLASGWSAEAMQGDVSDEVWTGELADRLASSAGGVDVLVNNAGISPKRNGLKIPVRDMDWSEWQRVMAINLGGAFLMCRALIPRMQARGWGRIVNISSQAGRARGDIADAAYAASKAGLLGFSRVLASEVGQDGVTVNCIAPGRIASPMQAVASEISTQEYIARIPVGRLGTAADIGSTVAFLASDESSFITGAIFDVNGGFFMG
jgi:3-oxoacyl-[acyl-carrier protein] reductase